MRRRKERRTDTTPFASRPDLVAWLGEPQEPEHNPARTALEWMVVFAAATLFALLLQLTTAQVFTIPSGSMTPTLEVGDRVVVNKWSYRFGSPHRGDLVVFTRPKGFDTGDDDLIKRVVATAGETVTIADNRLLVDGVPLDEPYLPEGTPTLPVGDHPCTTDAPCVIPDGHVWVMGDNRTNSTDSRYFDSIPVSSIVGQAELCIWPLSRAGRL